MAASSARIANPQLRRVPPNPAVASARNRSATSLPAATATPRRTSRPTATAGGRAIITTRPTRSPACTPASLSATDTAHAPTTAISTKKATAKPARLDTLIPQRPSIRAPAHHDPGALAVSRRTRPQPPTTDTGVAAAAPAAHPAPRQPRRSPARPCGSRWGRRCQPSAPPRGTGRTRDTNAPDPQRSPAAPQPSAARVGVHAP